MGECLGKNGTWVPEPLPSNREEGFLKEYRFNDFSTAAKVLEQAT